MALGPGRAACSRTRRGEVRLIMQVRTWEQFVDLALTEITEFGAGSPQVTRRLAEPARRSHGDRPRGAQSCARAPQGAARRGSRPASRVASCPGRGRTPARRSRFRVERRGTAIAELSSRHVRGVSCLAGTRGEYGQTGPYCAASDVKATVSVVSLVLASPVARLLS
jgi:hypothetical protein